MQKLSAKNPRVVRREQISPKVEGFVRIREIVQQDFKCFQFKRHASKLPLALTDILQAPTFFFSSTFNGDKRDRSQEQDERI